MRIPGCARNPLKRRRFDKPDKPARGSEIDPFDRSWRFPMSNDFLFTSESVSEGHPDKVADQISDAVLDAILEQDPNARVAAETLVSTGLVVMTGEITTAGKHDFARIARETVRKIGYNDPELRFDADGCAVMVCYGRQSPDIKRGVDQGSDDHLNQGRGAECLC